MTITKPSAEGIGYLKKMLSHWKTSAYTLNPNYYVFNSPSVVSTFYKKAWSPWNLLKKPFNYQIK